MLRNVVVALACIFALASCDSIWPGEEQVDDARATLEEIKAEAQQAKESAAKAREHAEKAREHAEEAAEPFRKAGAALREASDAFKDAAVDLVLPPAQEARLGRRMAAEIARDMKLRRDDGVTRYVRDLGTGLVKAVDDPPDAFGFEFHVVEDAAINAFAIPGGHIYLTTGLLEAAESEAEVVAVLGHEIAHVVERHAARRMSAAYGASILAQIALGKEASLLGVIVTEIVANGYLLKHSRDHEREADQLGLRYVVDAGHSPRGYGLFFARLAEQPQPPAILSTHPNPAERAATSRDVVAQLPVAVRERSLHADRYRKSTAGL